MLFKYIFLFYLIKSKAIFWSSISFLIIILCYIKCNIRRIKKLFNDEFWLLNALCVTAETFNAYSN